VRIYLLQHMLASYFGHWFNETVGWVSAARSAGMELKVFAARDLMPEVAEVTGARGVYALTRDIVERFGLPSRYSKTPDPYCQPMIDFMAWSEAFRQACRAIEEERIDKDDLLAVPFASINELHGVALWLDGVPEWRRPSVLLNFVEPDGTWIIENDRERMRADFSLSRYAARRLRALLPERRIMLTAADVRLCRLWQQALELPFRLAPMMMNYADKPPAPGDAPKAEGRLTISMMGDFRREKGSELVTDVIRTFASERPGSQFFVQVRSENEAAALRAGVQGIVTDEQLEIQIGPIPNEAYVGKLLASDLIVLPYVWHRYAIRTSGIFAEAAAYGIPVVAPSNTWMADRLDAGQGAGETFGEWTPAAIAAAMTRAAGRIGQLRQLAASRSAAWRREQSIHAYLPTVMKAWKGE
jgi:glycosyltransferase involved in cell wall biosynthesis